MKHLFLFIISICLIIISCGKKVGPEAKFELIFREDFNEVGDWELISSENVHGDDTCYARIENGLLELYGYSNSMHIDSALASASATLNYTDRIPKEFKAYRVKIHFVSGRVEGSDGGYNGGAYLLTGVEDKIISIHSGVSPSSYLGYSFENEALFYDFYPDKEKFSVFRENQEEELTESFKLSTTEENRFYIRFSLSALSSTLLFGNSEEKKKTIIDYIEVSGR